MLCLGEPEKSNLLKLRKLSKKRKVMKLKAQNGTASPPILSCLITLFTFSLFTLFQNTFSSELEIAEKNKAKQKGNSSLSSIMKYININAVKNKEEGFTIGIGKNFTNSLHPGSIFCCLKAVSCIRLSSLTQMRKCLEF